MWRLKFAQRCVAFLILFSLYTMSASAQQKWPIKRFKVEQSNPKSIFKLYAEVLNEQWFGDGDEQGLAFRERWEQWVDGSEIKLTDAQVTEIEQYLGLVAEQFQKWNFPPPEIRPVVKTDDGEQAFQIHIFDFPSFQSPEYVKVPEGLGQMHTHCPTDPDRVELNVMVLNSSHELFNEGGKLTSKAYQDLAHEVFHAVQNNSEMSRDLCRRFGDNTIGGWFTEASAQAVGIDTARLLRGQSALGGFGYRWGDRGYFRDLQDVLNKNEAYGTHGLWRFLAEADEINNPRPSATFTETDYSYLAEYLKHTFPGKPDRNNELKWFDAATKKVFNVRGHIMFRNFMPTLAAYARERGTGTSAAGSRNELVWLEALFGSCREHVLTDDKPYSIALVRHQRISAKCIRIRPDVADQVDISISQQGETEQYFHALSVGRLGGAQISEATVASLDAPGTGIDVNRVGEQLVTFKFRIPGGESHVFVITNAAPGLTSTETHEGRFRIEMAAIENTMAQATPQQPTSSRREARQDSNRTGSPDSATKEAIDELADDVQAGLLSLSSHSSTWASVSRNPDDPGCSPGLAAINLCGPSLNLSLELSPGMVGDTTITTGAGGELGQFMSMMQGMADAGPEEVSAGWFAAGERAFEQSGSAVTMNVGLVEYGFTGTLNNAHIVVNQGGEHAPYESLERNLTTVDGYRVYRPSGTVIIEEYGPHVLRGSFSGVLVNPSIWSGEGPMPVHGPISGRFNVLDPWRSDKRFVVQRGDDSVESAMEDMQQTLPGLAGFLQGNMPTEGGSGGESGGGPDSGGSSGGGKLECDCSCETIDELPEECKTQCFGQIIQCALAKEDG